jgi:hypothetical protein
MSNYFFVNAEALEVVEYLIDRFVNDSKSMGLTPVCLLLYASADLRVIKAGIRLDDALVKYLETRGIPYVDPAPYILEQYQQDDDFAGLRAPNGLLNSKGKRLVAEALSRGLASMALDRP